MSLTYLVAPESKGKNPQDDEGVSKGHRSQLKKFPMTKAGTNQQENKVTKIIQ